MPMAHRIEDIERIGPASRDLLVLAGIDTTEALLERCRDRIGRARVSAQTGLREAQLIRWVQIADLVRVPGVALEGAALLQAAGVETVDALAARDPQKLAARMRIVNEIRCIAAQAPSERTLSRWIEEARRLEPKVAH